MRHIGSDYEVIVVNDGSTDLTEANLRAVAGRDRDSDSEFPAQLRQTAAMMAGSISLPGGIIIGWTAICSTIPLTYRGCWTSSPRVTMSFPAWRFNRKGGMLTRKAAIADCNWLISRMSGVHLHDYGCNSQGHTRKRWSRA